MNLNNAIIDIEKALLKSAEGLHGSERDNKIVKELKALDEYVALEILKSMACKHIVETVFAAKRVITNKHLAKEFFEMGLGLADASSIKFWLEFGLAKLGTRKVVVILEEKESQIPGIIDKSLYFLPALVKETESKLLTGLISCSN